MNTKEQEPTSVVELIQTLEARAKSRRFTVSVHQQELSLPISDREPMQLCKVQIERGPFKLEFRRVGHTDSEACSAAIQAALSELR